MGENNSKIIQKSDIWNTKYRIVNDIKSVIPCHEQGTCGKQKELNLLSGGEQKIQFWWTNAAHD